MVASTFSPSRRLRLPLPHEGLFGLFFVATSVAVVLRERRVSSLVVFLVSCALVQLLLLAFWNLHPNAPRWRLRLVFYPLFINLIYPALPPIHAVLGIPLRDTFLRRVDQTIFGVNASLVLQRFVSPFLTDVLSAAYLFYLLYFGVSQLLYFIDRLDLAVRFYIGLFTVFAIGFFGYILVPAHGPYLAFAAQYSVPLVGSGLSQLNHDLVRLGSIKIDVFPSLHCAVPAYILAFDFAHKRRRFWVCLLPSILLILSTLYLRYHYVLDLFAGFALAAAAYLLATRWLPVHLQLAPERRA